MAKTHPQVEYEVENASGNRVPDTAGGTQVFKSSEKALAAAALAAMTTGSSTMSVLIHTRAGAKWYGGDDALDSYDEDPDASAFEQYHFTCNNRGRVA